MVHTTGPKGIVLLLSERLKKISARRENRENIVLSNDAALTKDFQTEFDKLWKLFEGNYEFDPNNQPVYRK